jgi:hypothetical protein
LSDDRDLHAGPAECALYHDAIIAQRCLTILGEPVPGSGAHGAKTQVPGNPANPSMAFLFCAAAQRRKGIDSLARLCQEKLEADPFSGCLFLFRSRRGTSI